MNVKFVGDKKSGQAYRHHAIRQMDLLRESMKYNDLQLDTRSLKFDNGVIVSCSICHGTELAVINHPFVYGEEVVEKKLIRPWEPFAILGSQLGRFHRWNWRTWDFYYSAYDHVGASCVTTWPNWSTWNWEHIGASCYTRAVWWGHNGIPDTPSDDAHDLKYRGVYIVGGGSSFENEVTGKEEISGVLSYDHTAESWMLASGNWGFDLQWYSHTVGPVINQSYYNDFYFSDPVLDQRLPLHNADGLKLHMNMVLFAKATTSEPTADNSYISMDLIFGGSPSTSNQIHTFYFSIGGHEYNTQYDHGLFGPDYRYGSPLVIADTHRHLQYVDTGMTNVIINLADLDDLYTWWDLDYVSFIGSNVIAGSRLQFQIDFIDFYYA